MGKRRLLDHFLLLLFPNRCFLCGRTLAGQGYICENCELPLLREEEQCARCGKMTRDCTCRKFTPAYCRAVVPLSYTGGVRGGIHRFKYRGNISCARFLASLIFERLQRYAERADVVTYVPMHRKKLKQRGFYPTRALALEICALTGLPLVEGILRHTGNQNAQMEQKGIGARMENARRSFALVSVRSELEGKKIILVDDVLTTGATAHVCAELLLESGAGEVWLAAIACPAGGEKTHLQKKGNAI